MFNFHTIWSPIKNHPQSHEAQILCLLWTSWGFSSCWCFRPGASWAGWGKRDDDKSINRKDFKSLKSINLCGLLTPRCKSEVTFLLIKRVISHIDFTFANVPDGAYQDIYISLTWLDVKGLKMSCFSVMVYLEEKTVSYIPWTSHVIFPSFSTCTIKDKDCIKLSLKCLTIRPAL